MDVKFVAAEFNYDGSRLTLMYNHDSRGKVELKSLRSDMGKNIQMSHVELRQIGPRDVAKIIGGMGACGLGETLLFKFHLEFSPISIRWQKNKVFH